MFQGKLNRVSPGNQGANIVIFIRKGNRALLTFHLERLGTQIGQGFMVRLPRCLRFREVLGSGGYLALHAGYELN